MDGASPVSGKAWLAKPLCLLACLVLAALALGNGIDRLSYLKPSLAARIPAIFAAAALATRGQVELVSGKIDDAYADGLAAVKRAPVDPPSAALLGAARLGKGDAEGARKAFLVAGKMGWRVPLTQVYWMKQALAMGDTKVAAIRLDALLRQHPWMMSDVSLISPLEATDEGREAMSARLSAAPPWLAPYAREVTDLPGSVAAQRARVLGLLPARGVLVGCDLAAFPATRLASVGLLAEARSLWREQCPEAGSGLLSDPDFAHLRIADARTFFEWHLIGSAEVGMIIVPGERAGTQKIEMENAGAFNRAVLQQLVVAPPGRYRLAWDAAGANGQPSAQVFASIGCAPGGGAKLDARPVGGATWESLVTIGADCPAHWLAFTLQPNSGTVKLSAVRLEQVR